LIAQITRPYWIAAQLVLVAAAAYFAAQAVSSFVRGRLDRGAVATRQGAVAVAAPAKTAALSEYMQIARRDLFAQPAPESASASEPSRRGPSNLRLLGTGRHGSRAYAIIEDSQAKRQDVLTVGDKLGDAEVSRIGYRRVVLNRSGVEEILVQPSDGAVPAAGTAPAPPSPPPGATSQVSDDQIRKTGDDRYLIARGEVDHTLENLSDVFTQMRAVPNIESGRTTGFRLFAIRPGSIFEKIGLLNNDVVQRINGVELNDPAKAMTLFQDLQGQTRLSVDVLRGSETRTLSYEIR
jgi:general secretion pathway protein C